MSRTVVLCPDEGNAVITYACLSAGAIVLAEVPGALRRKCPTPFSLWCALLGCPGGSSAPPTSGSSDTVQFQ
ncbi:MAG: hypothetical protein ACKO45_01800 [Cyanobium sp.]